MGFLRLLRLPFLSWSAVARIMAVRVPQPACHLLLLMLQAVRAVVPGPKLKDRAVVVVVAKVQVQVQAAVAAVAAVAAARAVVAAAAAALAPAVVSEMVEAS